MLFLIISMFARKASSVAIESSDLSNATFDALPPKFGSMGSTGESSDLNLYDIDKIDKMDKIKMENPQIDEIDATQLHECIQSGRFELCELPDLSASEELIAQLFEFWADRLYLIKSNKKVMQEAEAILTQVDRVVVGHTLKKRMRKSSTVSTATHSPNAQLAQFRGGVATPATIVLLYCTYKFLKIAIPEAVRYATSIKWTQSEATESLGVIVACSIIIYAVADPAQKSQPFVQVLKSWKEGLIFIGNNFKEFGNNYLRFGNKNQKSSSRSK
eukprot:NODE_927_length_3038_cov_0.223810.p1 type:complete len:273 gc:universal NODE_927_length_3038_cov_0.223810:1130-312(-)